LRAADLIGLGHRHQPEPEHVVAPYLQLLEVFLLRLEADDIENYFDRQRVAELSHEIAMSLGEEAVDTLPHHLLDAGLHPAKALRRQNALHDAAQASVGLAL